MCKRCSRSFRASSSANSTRVISFEVPVNWFPFPPEPPPTIEETHSDHSFGFNFSISSYPQSKQRRTKGGIYRWDIASVHNLGCIRSKEIHALLPLPLLHSGKNRIAQQFRIRRNGQRSNHPRLLRPFFPFKVLGNRRDDCLLIRLRSFLGNLCRLHLNSPDPLLELRPSDRRNCSLIILILCLQNRCIRQLFQRKRHPLHLSQFSFKIICAATCIFRHPPRNRDDPTDALGNAFFR